jgi:biotin synthase
MSTRHNWTKEEIIAIYNKPMMDLLYEAATIHREHHDPNVVQVSTLLSIKLAVVQKIVATAPQARYHTSVEGNDLMSVNQVKQALRAKESGSSRVCIAAWRNVKDGPEFDQVLKWFEQSINSKWKFVAWNDYRKSSPSFSRSWFIRLQS